MGVRVSEGVIVSEMLPESEIESVKDADNEIVWE